MGDQSYQGWIAILVMVLFCLAIIVWEQYKDNTTKVNSFINSVYGSSLLYAILILIACVFIPQLVSFTSFENAFEIWISKRRYFLLVIGLIMIYGVLLSLHKIKDLSTGWRRIILVLSVTIATVIIILQVNNMDSLYYISLAIEMAILFSISVVSIPVAVGMWIYEGFTKEKEES